MQVCSAAGCAKQAKVRGLCWTHEFSERYRINPEFRENRKKTKRGYNRRLLLRYRDGIAHTLGGWKCVACGETDRRVLVFDHRIGDGHDERDKMGGQLPTIRFYYHNATEAKERLQVLCANCNWKKNVQERYGANQSKKALYERELRLRLINLLGGRKCVECGEPDVRLLTIDHVRGGGAEDRRRMKGYGSMIRHYLFHPDEAQAQLQVLCRNCNWRKHLVDGVRVPQTKG